ncbi:sigma-70 family RNA polymerase sigma factor [Anaerosalibacter sp. Marseille-P3206]|uniref:sigma-70 family RNA polymerase sigma factor n=1 Tax=Anaerosalibacter sp. Marseille-P3206 TaxID=1871005 RepID=UPI0013562FE0|nr:RNA polymerase sigma factor RpoD/SigA [Anaerosalibacter sp. Marseille-P3206]
MKNMTAKPLDSFDVSKNRKPSNRELLLAYKKNKDINTRNKIIENNIGLVYIAAKNKKKGYCSLSFEDLVQEGVIGMIRGIEKFDTDRETSFSTYVYYWINHEINRAIMNTGHLIRLPAHMYEKVNKLTQIENLNQSQDNNIDVKSLCQKIKITENEYNNIDYYRNSFYNFTSLNTNLSLDSEESYVELQDFIPSNEPSTEEIVIDDDLKNNIEKILNTLPSREKEILELRFGLKNGRPATLEEIGDKYNLTRERIRQIEVKTLSKIKISSNGVSLKDYLSYP